MRRLRVPPFPYIVAVAAVAVGATLRFGLDPLWGDRLPFIGMFGAVVVAGWFGGLGPGLLATALGTLVADFVDIGLPGVDGFEVARRLRAGESGGRTKLVALTGYGQEADTRRTREAGFDLHLIKPIDADTLANVLAMLATDSMTPSETER